VRSESLSFLNSPAELTLPHGRVRYPAFLPDATLGVVRSLDAQDLQATGIQALVMNTFHLMQRPGSSTLQALGGLHAFSNWQQPIFTDSGGYQAYSLIRQNPKLGSLSDQGLRFNPPGSSRTYLLTPEKTIQLQFSYGADVVICLDDCTHASASLEIQRTAVERTLAWARRCKATYLRLVEQKRLEEAERPLLFAVVQGGASLELRKRCAETLLGIGFDGYGYGGYPLDKDNRLLADLLAYTRQLIPPAYPLHALGVGHPPYVADCAHMGYQLFDSALPTRDARRGRLYTFTSTQLTGDWFHRLYIHDSKHIKAGAPVDAGCDCHTCRHYSLGYLHHLFKTGESLYFRLATLHNLRFMVRLTQHLGEEFYGPR
jgi:queuine tRNA-ribosyltransferase